MKTFYGVIDFSDNLTEKRKESIEEQMRLRFRKYLIAKQELMIVHSKNKNVVANNKIKKMKSGETKEA